MGLKSRDFDDFATKRKATGLPAEVLRRLGGRQPHTLAIAGSNNASTPWPSCFNIHQTDK